METTIVYWGNFGIMKNELETTIVYWCYIGIMKSKMETTIVYWDYIGIVENGNYYRIFCNKCMSLQDQQGDSASRWANQGKLSGPTSAHQLGMSTSSPTFPAQLRCVVPPFPTSTELALQTSADMHSGRSMT